MPEANANPEQLARDYFAKSRGIVQPEKAPEPEATPDIEDSPEPEARAPEREDPPEVDHDAVTETDATTEVAEEDQPRNVESLADIAEVLGVDVSELYGVTIPVTNPDGERGNATIGEWKEAYQAAEVYRKRASDLDAKRAQTEQEYAQAQAHIQGQLKQASALLNAAERELTKEYEGINWNELRANDPAEWAARRQNFVERENAIKAAKQEAVSVAQSQTAEQAEKVQRQRQEVLKRENALMRDAIPEWKDETKAKAEQAELFDYLVSLGFPAQDVGRMENHRLVVAFRKSMLWDKQQKAGGVAKKKLVTVAKRVMKPGAAVSKAQQSQDRDAKLVARLKKSGSDDDAFALLKARRFGK